MTESNQPPQSPHPIVTSSSLAGESSDSLNGHGPSEPTTAAELAGLQLDAEDRLDASEPPPETPNPTTSRRSIARSPLPRTLLVAGALGFVATFALLFSRLNSGNRPVADTPEAPEAPPEAPFDQSDVYRSQLALVDQADAQQPQPAPTPPSEPPPVAEENPPEAPPTVTTAAPSPAPRPTPAAQPEPPPRSAPATQPEPEPEPIDPFERWHTLAQAGTQGEQFALVPPVEPAAPLTVTPGNTPNTSPPSNPVAPIEVAAASGTAGFPVAIIGDNPIERMTPPSAPSAPSAEPAFSPPGPQPQSQEPPTSLLASAPPSIPIQTAQTNSPGTQGILERRPTSDRPSGTQTNQADTQVLQVPMGTTVAAELAVPIVASRSGETLGRFAVRLTEDLIDPYEQVALPAGTLLITDVLSIDDDSLAIQQTVVALVYEDAQGQIVQEAIAPDVLIIRGRDGGALIASLAGGGNRRNLLTDILAIGGASALAEVGSALNEGDLFTSTASSSDGDETETTTTTVRDSDDPNVLGAIMEGFFESTADLLQDEIEDDRDHDEDLDPVLTVAQGQDLQVFVNGILNIRR